MAKVEGLPDYSKGYVYLPALVMIVMTSMLTTKVGAKMATNLPTAVLKKILPNAMFVAATMLL